MLVEERTKVGDLSSSDILELADHISHNGPIVRQIFECAKVFARIHESGSFTYARHHLDLGTGIVTADDIAARMRDPARSTAVREALVELEERCVEWPFSRGSNSWVLLEILHPDINLSGPENKPTIIFRKAVRVSSSGKITTSPLLERMFKTLNTSSFLEGRFYMSFDPTVKLRNISGTGIYTKLVGCELESGTILKESVDCFISDILEENFDIPLSVNPGFYLEYNGSIINIRSPAFEMNKRQSLLEKKQEKLLPPLPIFGLVK